VAKGVTPRSRESTARRTRGKAVPATKVTIVDTVEADIFGAGIITVNEIPALPAKHMGQQTMPIYVAKLPACDTKGNIFTASGAACYISPLASTIQEVAETQTAGE